MRSGCTDDVIVVRIGKNKLRPFEYTIVTDVKPGFLLPATPVKTDGSVELLYSVENLIPVARCVEEPGTMLSNLFELLSGYIHCLLEARDMLLDTRMLSSDPDAGVFVLREFGSCMKVKTIWGADELVDEREKICRIANIFAGCERVMGAKTSMERMIEFIRSENPSLLNCLKMAEIICREWNNIYSTMVKH